jgi:hypothetical protein
VLPPKTHFAQVSLKAVRKIAAEQILREIASEPDLTIRAKSLQESQLPTLGPLLELSSAFSQGEEYTKS